MNIFQHKHKFRCRNEVFSRMDEIDRDKVEGKYDWNNPNAWNDIKYDYIVLDCICYKCEIAGLCKAYSVLSLVNSFRGGIDDLQAFISKPMTDRQANSTRNDPEFWEFLIKKEWPPTQLRCYFCGEKAYNLIQFSAHLKDKHDEPTIKAEKMNTISSITKGEGRQ